jgi:hypothetical protein
MPKPYSVENECSLYGEGVRIRTNLSINRNKKSPHSQIVVYKQLENAGLLIM